VDVEEMGGHKEKQQLKPTCIMIAE